MGDRNIRAPLFLMAVTKKQISDIGGSLDALWKQEVKHDSVSKRILAMLPRIDPSKLDAVDRLERVYLYLGLLLRDTAKTEFSGDGLPQLFKGACPILIYLHRHGASQLSAIAAGTGQRPAALTPNAKELLSRGLVARYMDPKDARASRLELTELGEKYAVLTERGRAQAVAKLLSKMDKEQAERFEECLDLVYEALQENS